ncbi:alpha-ketoacid dehydrogenase subunit beta [Staphylococcus casei]|jgi:2-oxoisovalerate dehydrogenase E1 component beta subunit|uniref:Pyruvate dehydrogenase E1 component subunit beta n=1 Tax=Staphylococcus succinus TaxID=61015 RepID=A0A9Q6HNV9_9STAP|nr:MULTISPECIES: alpha-ketoacid dehydrogenase subunit beta [Staphylococcus]MBU0437702.1 alpha-ketoacid dehydrogenase subunit beta [Staphylococcus succinus]MDH9160004.1 alpha-ketoacid dehydrogenase subunit beta [Staphylococcus succinus]MEB7461404.1 alpha-ketoacid dehydrogenase subunit beta [Staphylococcus succinus]MEB8124640.1 alpha-ketoacid dehydrogenase subunit beta [Staphylococcus succinus]MEB8126631.1 alpha-ketoacid dehydrogenase subunit beta [Staphylococcus succinus]
MAKLSYLDAIHQGLDQAMEKDNDVFILGEDVGKKGGVFGVTLGLQEKYGEARVLDTPLAESNIVGTSIGAAMLGKRPVAEIQFAEYILPATNQIMSEAAKMRYRSNNDFHSPITIRSPFGGGIHGALYHSQSVESIFASTPGLTIVIPSSPYDAKGLLLASIESNDPVLYFEHKKAYRLLKEEVPEAYYTVPIGKADVKREGDDITVFTYGLCVNYCIQAADMLSEDGINVEVVDLRTVYPLDKETIIERAKLTGKVLLVTEDNLEGSIISEVSAIISENCLFDLDAPIMRLAGPDVPSMPFAPTLEDEFMINPDKIKIKMRELAEF